MNNISKKWLRYLLQWGTLLAIVAFAFKIFGNEKFDPEAYCPFGGLETLGSYLVKGTLACSMTSVQIMMGVVLAIGVVLFSRLFCSYICPLGTIVEWLGKLRTKLKIKGLDIAPWSVADKVLRIVKYILLFTIFYFTISSSELFCKNLDPYYAVATGFRGEITLWMVYITITLFILGSFFIKMFWCRYICPLGAISNIFKFTLTFILILGIYIILSLFGIQISWIVPLVITCVVGYINEVIFKAPKVFPILHISRNEDACNKCGVCTKKCPYSINIPEVKRVKCVDCTLCGECIASCHKDALTINGIKGFNWVPGLITIILFSIALFLGTTMELPTIDEKWGDNNQNLEKCTIEGLRSVKCYGSSKAFSAQLQRIKGIYGVATYVKHSKVNIYYNPNEINLDQIKAAIYTPVKSTISQPSESDSLIKVITIRTENMYDKLDPNYLGMQFRGTDKPYFGLETEYACPLIVRVYMRLDEPVDEKFLKQCVEKETLELPMPGGDTRVLQLNYKFASLEPNVDTITRREFLENQLGEISYEYNKNIEKYGNDNKEVYEIVYPSLNKPIIKRYIPYLSSYLSQIDGMLGFKAVVNADEKYAFNFIYDKTIINEDKLWEILNAETWTIIMSNGNSKELDAGIKFKNKGKVL